MKISKWYVIGISLFGLVMGYLVGASNTPVVGAIIAALVPVVSGLASVFGAKKEDEADNKGSLNQSTRFIGVALAFFSIFLFCGLMIGEWHRNNNLLNVLENDVEKEFVWSNLEKKPSNFQEAIQWIQISERLKKIGYGNEKIEELYELSLSSKNSDIIMSQEDFSQLIIGMDSLVKIVKDLEKKNGLERIEQFGPIINNLSDLESLLRKNSRNQ